MDRPEGWSEDRLHRWLAEQSWPADLAGSRGHDAAVLRPRAGRPTLCTDQCVEAVHFATGTAGDAVGAKAVLRTLSDLAATAARPHGVTLALAAPADAAERWIQACLTGAHRAAQRHGCELVAGDLSRTAGPAVLSVTALGFVETDLVPVGRDRATVGQAVVVTGPLGGSLSSGRHLAPVPRFDAARELWRELGATAMMDVSDGLAWDLYRLARASALAIRLDVDRVPVHPDATRAAAASGRTALDHAMHDGEDHELIATVPRVHTGDVVARGWTVIGSCEPGDGLTLAGAQRKRSWSPGDGGWTHGAD